MHMDMLRSKQRPALSSNLWRHGLLLSMYHKTQIKRLSAPESKPVHCQTLCSLGGLVFVCWKKSLKGMEEDIFDQGQLRVPCFV